ncbi:Hypothetical predicted protein [Cloeon dipterum]|uniref:Uncharacterized protein n=1 Tax=Cloeon dipterum TaxID=197152 RepID=A0A8S1DUL9_9INSE|nr:Hypothetical predicted protein [Cloeon dipterum]
MCNLRATVREKKVVGYAVKPGRLTLTDARLNGCACLCRELRRRKSSHQIPCEKRAKRWAATSRRDDSSFCSDRLAGRSGGWTPAAVATFPLARC